MFKDVSSIFQYIYGEREREREREILSNMVSLHRSNLDRPIGLMSRVFANLPGDRGSIPGGVIPKTLKIVLDTSLLNTQHYKVCIKVKVEQFREKK